MYILVFSVTGRWTMKTPEEVQELQKELQAWMEKNDLTHDTGWRKPKEHVGEPQTLADGPVYLILWFEGDFYYVMWPSGSPDRDWHEQRPRNSTQS